jgi:hypothetical protein
MRCLGPRETSYFYSINLAKIIYQQSFVLSSQRQTKSSHKIKVAKIESNGGGMQMHRKYLVLVGLLTTCLLIPAPALSSQWMWTHGTSGQFYAAPMNGSGSAKVSKNGLIAKDLAIYDPQFVPLPQHRPGYAYFAVPTIGSSSWAVRYLKVIVGFESPPPLLMWVGLPVT